MAIFRKLYFTMPAPERPRSFDISTIKVSPEQRQFGGGFKKLGGQEQGAEQKPSKPNPEVPKKPGIRSFEEVLEEALKDPRVKREYDALEPEFQRWVAESRSRMKKRQDDATRHNAKPE